MENEDEQRVDATGAVRKAETAGDIRKDNIRRTFFTGKGRISAIVVGCTFAVLAIIGYANLPRGNSGQVAIPAGATPNVGGLAGDRMASSAQEAEMRRQANAQAASEAAANGQPYVASPVLMAESNKGEANSGAWGGMGAGAPVKAQPTTAPATAVTSLNTQYPAQIAAPSNINVKQIATDLMADKTGDVSSQINAVLGVSGQESGKSRSFTTGYFPQAVPKAETAASAAGSVPGQPNGVMVSAAGSAANGPSATKSVLPGWTAGTGYYCKLSYGVNSDLARKDVLGKCFGGAAEGATFIGSAEPSPEGVANPAFTLLFKKVQIPGKGTFTVNAIGIDNDSMELAAQDDVNDHAIVKFSMLGIAGLLKGLGQAASIVTGTSTTQTVGNVSNTSLSVQKPDVRQQIGMAAGGVGTAIGDYTQKKAEAMKTTIKLFPNKDIGIVLLDDVTDQKN